MESLLRHPISLNGRIQAVRFNVTCRYIQRKLKETRVWLAKHGCEYQKALPKELVLVQSPGQRHWDDLNEIQEALKQSREGAKGHDKDWKLRI